jgi:hypothetical protein
MKRMNNPDTNDSVSQSTNHVLMIEPAVFYANPETMETNAYQVAEHEPRDVVYQRALKEYRDFRDALSAKGVIITQARGYDNCPDMVFPNCMSTHDVALGDPIDTPRLYLYPMMNENRRAEHSSALIGMLSKSYPDVHDWRHYADQGLHLESTASIARDRVNSTGYVALSPRTHKELAEKWLAEMGYEGVYFETRSHAGIPVYHTDCVMWIGTGIAGICTEAITEEYRDDVLTRLRSTHEVVEFDMRQLRAFCGNALEVRGADDKRYLAMSSGAVAALRDDQRAMIEANFEGIVHSNLATLETYGGGSARCMLMELF